jgi:hypothetical protein
MNEWMNQLASGRVVTDIYTEATRVPRKLHLQSVLLSAAVLTYSLFPSPFLRRADPQLSALSAREMR